MTNRPFACVVLAAGKGTRMKSDLPKVLHPLAGRSMLHHVLDAATRLKPERMVVVVGPGMEAVSAAVAPIPTVVQTHQLGTADAVRAAAPLLEGFEGDVLVLYGDTPLLTSATLERMLVARRGNSEPAVVVLGMRPQDPGAYGRLILDEAGNLDRITEYLDASPKERAVDLCNAGIMAFDGRWLFTLLDKVRNDNAKGEYYLTDTVALAGDLGLTRGWTDAPEEEVMGVNSRVELALAEKVMQRRLREAAMVSGATLQDPDTTYFTMDTRLGRDVTVGGSVVFGPGVVVGDRVEIRPFCHLEGVTVNEGAIIGPFARLRPGSTVGVGAHVGNFVELKNATLEPGAKANHLTYLGDVRVGAKANVGAGTITCNYDGFTKSRTEIGAGAFIGSNSSLVAPVTVGDGAIIGAGSVVVRDVPADGLAVGRARQADYPGWAARFRAGRKKKQD